MIFKEKFVLLLVISAVVCKPVAAVELPPSIKAFDYHGQSSFVTTFPRPGALEAETIRVLKANVASDLKYVNAPQDLKEVAKLLSATRSQTKKNAQWFRQLQHNVNSASIITGITAVSHSLFYNTWNVIANGSIKFDFSKGGTMQTTLFLTTLAILLEACNQLFIRPAYYKRYNYAEALAAGVEVVTEQQNKSDQ
jgi:hypothetical protein